MPKICLYAEVLTHIRQLTLHATLQTDGDETPRIDVSSDKQVITVVHGGESSSLWLPTQILGTANVTFLTPSKTELTARVQIEDAASWKEFDQNSIEYPWDATVLSNETTVSCKTCCATILWPRKIKSWKDLPSQDWADVMDLWYCHKPHDQHDNNRQKSAAEAKGFSARSRLASKVGTGMVDIACFVLNPDDCDNIQIPDRPNDNDFKPVSILCSNCLMCVGSFSGLDNLVRLQKSDLIVKIASDAQFVSFDASTFISAQLLSLIESSSLRKIVVYSLEKGDGKTDKEQAGSVGVVSGQAGEQKIDQSVLKMAADLNTSTNHRGTADASNDGDDVSQLYSNGVAFGTAAIEPSQNSQPGASSSQPGSNYQAVTVEEVKDSPSGCSTIASPPEQPSLIASPRDLPYHDENNSEEEGTLEKDNELEGLLLWIFNPNIYYSSSLHPSNITKAAESTMLMSSSTTKTTLPSPDESKTSKSQTAHAHRAMKIFYKLIKNPTSYLQPFTSYNSSQPNPTPESAPNHDNSKKKEEKQDKRREEEYEELVLLKHSHLQSLTTTLQKSTQILPETARRFQDWTIGLLDRYEKTSTAEDVMAQNPLARRAEVDLGGSSSSSAENGNDNENRNGNGTTTKSTGTNTISLPAGYQELYL